MSAAVSLTELEKPSQLSLDFNNQLSQHPTRFSSYVVYVDESGDSNLEKIDQGYPVFILAFCIFHKRYYANKLVPEVQGLKFNYFGHDMIIFHEKEIRKKEPPFSFRNRAIEEQFMQDLSKIIEESKFILISAAILKNQLTVKPEQNAYHIALKYCLENLYLFLMEKQQHEERKHLTHIVFESRGAKEDNELELEFRRICNRENKFKEVLPFEIIIKSKQANSTGMQFADLFARPIGRYLIDGTQKENRAFRILENKFFCKDRSLLGSNYLGLGLNLYPQKSEKPPKTESLNADQGTPQSI
ncbi:3-deoxy-D-manno-octulosonic acid transferase [Neisseria dumasiana]|nr:3-deoxy-D-manno-octulosonic acid transferase [Neisseria dumasiana]